jgi:hypothetical protein
MDSGPRYWFRAKRYGWGWGLPLTWEGWLVITVWLCVLVAVVPSLRSHRHVLDRVVIIVGMVAALTGVCYWKGEPLRWRSGRSV